MAEWHATAPRRSARLGGFFVHTKDIEQLAQQARQKVLRDPQFLQWAKQVDIEEDRADPTKPGAPSSGAPAIRDLTEMFLDQIPDEGYKLIPWLGREIQRGLLNGPMDSGARVQWGHARDIATQASKWFAWAREHNKPLPEINNRGFGFQDLEDWVYQMNAAGVKEGSGWQDSTPIYTWQDGWHMDLVGSKDLAKEGELMGHCVGGYCDQVDRGSSSIFSLRDPGGLPHVTIEVEGRFNGNDPPQDAQHPLNIVQIQGKSDTEPIPEYRQRVDEWFQHLEGLGSGGNRYWLTEEDPDREPEYETVDHQEGPVPFDDTEDVLDYRNLIMGDDPQYHFGRDDDGNWEGNTIYTQYPRQLEMDTKRAEQLGIEFFTNIIQGDEADPATITNFIQGLWMAVHQVHSEGQDHSWDRDQRTQRTNDDRSSIWQAIVHQIEWAFMDQPVTPLIESAFDYMEQLIDAPDKFMATRYRTVFHPQTHQYTWNEYTAPQRQQALQDWADLPYLEETSLGGSQRIKKVPQQYEAELMWPYEASDYGGHAPNYSNLFQDMGMPGLEAPQEEQRVASSEEQDWVPIIGQGGNEVIRGIPIGGEDGEDTGLYQWQPEPRNYGLDEALTDLRDGGYHWRVEQGEQPDMWKLQHKREPFWHDISTRDLNLRGYNVYYNDDYLPRAQTNRLDPGAPKFNLHDTAGGEWPGRIWATQRADVEGWQRPEPGALNEPHIREKHPKLWQQHWGSAIIRDNEEDWHTKEAVGSQEGGSDGEEAPEAAPEAQAPVEYNWPSLDDVLGISQLAVDNHQGYRDTGLIEGAVGNTQMAHGYGQHTDIFDTAAHLIAKIQRQQALVEGNKRTAAATGLHFLEENGIDTTPLAQEGVWQALVDHIYALSDSSDESVAALAQFLSTTITGRTAGFEGGWEPYPNEDTWNVAMAIQGNFGYEEYDGVRKFMQAHPEATLDQFAMWCIQNIIGPFNKEREKEAHEWNSIPQHDRLDYGWEELKDQSPGAADLVSGINSIFGMPNEDIGDIDLNETIIHSKNVDWTQVFNELRGELGLEPVDIGRPEWLAKTADADSWTEPMATTLNENVEVPGNAPGLNPRGDVPVPPLRRPCYCDIGLLTPHEWIGSCENGKRPTMEHEAAQGQNWVYLDGKVGFGQWWSDVAAELAIELGYNETMQKYIANTIARNGIPSDLDIAVGSIRSGKPQIWVSSLDRNAVWDAVNAANPQ